MSLVNKNGSLMRIIALINVFNEEKGIARCIESIHDVVDEVWVYDGAYRQYPHQLPYSTDRTLEIASKYPKVKIFETQTAYENQCIKRTKMFENGRKGDYFFKLDADEYVVNPEAIRENLKGDVGWCWTVSNLYEFPVVTARIFKWRAGMHYAGRHHWLYDGNKNFITSDQNMNPKFKHRDTNIKVYNFRDSSAPDRLPTKLKFAAVRNIEEFSYKNENDVYKKFGGLKPHLNRAQRTINRVETITESINDPGFTVSMMFSRDWAVDKFFKHFKGVILPDNCEVVAVVDSDSLKMKNKIIKYLKDAERFDGIKVIFTKKPKPEEFSNVAERRKRIISNWYAILAEARGEVIIGTEDDSLPESDAYVKLLRIMRDENAHFVQGNIIGRWGENICPAWRIEQRNSKPYKVYNLEEKQEGTDIINGCGWYCFVAYTNVMRRSSFTLDSLLPLGPDLRFGYELFKMGFRLLHSWDVKVEHFTKQKSLKIGEVKTKSVTYIKDTNNIWQLQQ